MYTCDCPAGYSGEFCEETTCSSVECQNGGSCLIDGCICKNGFNGVNCETEVCIDNQCQNGGECKRDGESETCDCKPGFDGEHCEDEICIKNLCENGECIRNGLEETCYCEEEWFGSLCTSQNPCFEYDCGENMVCFLSFPDHERECVPDTIGFVNKASNVTIILI